MDDALPTLLLLCKAGVDDALPTLLLLLCVYVCVKFSGCSCWAGRQADGQAHLHHTCSMLGVMGAEAQLLEVHQAWVDLSGLVCGPA